MHVYHSFRIVTIQQVMVLSPCTHWRSACDWVCIMPIFVIKTNSFLPDVHPLYFLTRGGKPQQVERCRCRELYFSSEWTIVSREDTSYNGLQCKWRNFRKEGRLSIQHFSVWEWHKFYLTCNSKISLCFYRKPH